MDAGNLTTNDDDPDKDSCSACDARERTFGWAKQKKRNLIGVKGLRIFFRICNGSFVLGVTYRWREKPLLYGTDLNKAAKKNRHPRSKSEKKEPNAHLLSQDQQDFNLQKLDIRRQRSEVAAEGNGEMLWSTILLPCMMCFMVNNYAIVALQSLLLQQAH